MGAQGSFPWDLVAAKDRQNAKRQKVFNYHLLKTQC